VNIYFCIYNLYFKIIFLLNYQGIAMGSGSEVAMEASQLVLLDSNFSSILIAIENGRLVFENLRKVVLYLLPGGCFAELIPVLMSIVVGVSQDLSSFQMIIISLFTDIAPSLSLMMQKPETSLLKQPPRSKNHHLVDWKFLLQAYLFLGVMVTLGSQIMFFIYMKAYANLSPSQIFFSFENLPLIFNETYFDHFQTNFNITDSDTVINIFNEYFYTGQTVTFVAIVILQIFGNLLSTRTHIKSFFFHTPWSKKSRNLWVFAAELTSISIMLLIIYVPIFQSLFFTRPVPVQFFFMPFGFALLIFAIDETRKFCVRRKILFFHKIGW
jgi:sodium/potassium-transporting ATPase subunit alpha